MLVCAFCSDLAGDIMRCASENSMKNMRSDMIEQYVGLALGGRHAVDSVHA